MKKLLPLLILIVAIVVTVRHFSKSPARQSSPGSNQSAKSSSVGSSGSGSPAQREKSSLILIPAGEFSMGSKKGHYDEKPAHKVKISAFYMDRYEITQKQYEKIMGENPSRWKNAAGPVEQVRWNSAVKFCNARSRAEGLEPCYDLNKWTCDFSANGYRLPTEAEWEYACRAGTKGDYFFENNHKNLDNCLWYKSNSRGQPHPVGRKRANAWGLFDMLGNVYEWCNDAYSPDAYRKTVVQDPHGPDPEDWDKKVLRGGSWQVGAKKCRSWSRYCETTGAEEECYIADHIGFRCVRRVAAKIVKH